MKRPVKWTDPSALPASACVLLVVLSALLLPRGAGAAPVSLGFEGAPPLVFGGPGEVLVLEVFATLTTVEDPGSVGAQAWQIGLTVDGGVIRSISVEGVLVSTKYDEDNDPATPLVDPYLFDLGESNYYVNQLATNPLDGRKGAISAVILRQDRLMVLNPGTARLARITVEATVPLDDRPAPLTLRFEDGFKGSGIPVRNSIVFNGLNSLPSLGSATTVIRQGPRAALGLEGCPEEILGKKGETKSFDVFATLTTSGNPFPEGAGSWQIGVAVDGGVVRSVSVGGITVPAIYDDDGDPGTPPLNPFSFDLEGAALVESEAATRPADGTEGAVSRVVLGVEKKTALLPEGTARLARFTVEVTMPAAAAELGLRFLDGLVASGEGVRNLAAFDGGLVYPALGSCTIRLAIEAPSGVLPGDCNLDRRVDISDGICLLDFLFLGGTLPCGEGSETDPGNVSLADANGDRSVDLSDSIALFGYLFLGGPPHVLGEDCTEIAGCGTACP